jgi:tRNA 2-thiouridine synthesizing protein B
MSTLHTVNKSPFERGSLASALAHALPGDAVLLIEDAVVGARSSAAKTADLIKAAMPACKLYVLGPDLTARGIPSTDVVEGINIVDYPGFVDLVADHDKTQAWL